MEVHDGIPVGPGYAVGEVFVLRREPGRLPLRRIGDGDVEPEIARLAAAVRSAEESLDAARDALGDAPDVEAILGSHRMMLADPSLRGSIEGRLRSDLVSAENAVADTLDAVAARFESLADPYLRQRAIDVRDIQRRLLLALQGSDEDQLRRIRHPVILAARELTPSETALLDRKRVLAFLTDAGGPTSHTAIVARNLGLPAVVGLGDVVSRLADGQTVVVDGNAGAVVVDPDPAAVTRFREKAARHTTYVRDLQKIRDYPAETRDGHRIHLMGNIELPGEVAAVVRAGGDGIGLFRTEFMAEPGRPLPDEEAHLAVYVRALEQLGGRPLTIRTFDFGADKVHPDGDAPPEPNPALGVRSIRLCLERPQIFLPQLRAILRASAHGNVRCLFPMISSLAELRAAKELLERARAALRGEGVFVSDSVPVGVMIEIPAAAVIADFLVEEVDFLSIGSNDLIQYALAVDRVNERVAHLYQPAHPAILRLIQNVLRAAADRGIPVSLCGEMAGDRRFTVLLLGMGFRDLSLSPGAIPEVKQAIRTVTVEQARQAAAWCAEARSAAEVRDRLRSILSDDFPEAL